MAKTVSNNSKTKQALRNRTRLEWLLFAALLLIGFLFLASKYSWWPLSTNNPDLGSAFSTSNKIPKALTTSSSASPASGVSGTGSGTTTGRTSTSSSTTSSGTTTGSGSSNNGGGSGDGSGGGGSSGGGSSTSPLLTFAAGVNVGDSKQQVDATVNGLNENCAVTVDLPLGLGRQEVCTYTQNGTGTATVTYLDNHVLSASLAGL